MLIKLSAQQLMSPWEKAVGLMGREKAEPIYFTTRWGIHTLFMQFPIDVIILDDQYRVMQTVQSLMPNRIFMWNPKYEKVVELPMGTIEKEKIKKGMTIKLVPLKTKIIS